MQTIAYYLYLALLDKNDLPKENCFVLFMFVSNDVPNLILSLDYNVLFVNAQQLFNY